jgi:hypothetical protein
MHATDSAHFIADLIILITVREEHLSRSYSLRSPVRLPVNSVLCRTHTFSSASCSQNILGMLFHSDKTNKKTNPVALSPRTNSIDWATATCRRNLVLSSVDRGVSRGKRGGSPTVVNLSFLDRSRYFSFKSLLIYPHKGWMDPVPDPLLTNY